MITAVVIDDEAIAANVLQLMIERHVPQISNLRVATSIVAAKSLIDTLKPDIVFLDIVMPEVNGFEFLTSLDAIDFEVIFTTAYDEYAIKAVRFSAFDYLLKPIDAKDLQDAVARYGQKQQQFKQSRQLLNNLITNLESKREEVFKLAIPTVGRTLFFSTTDIVRLEGVGNYTRFYMSNGEQHLSSKTLKEYADILQTHNFLRIHKSHLVNRSAIITYKNEGAVALKENIVLPVSRQRRPEIKNLLTNHQ